MALSFPVVTSAAAGILGLVQVFLTAKVILHRREQRVSMGDNGDVALQRKIRAHGNFTETVPMGLILVLLVELGAASGSQVERVALPAGLAGLLVSGRLLHAAAFLDTQWPLGRVGGMACTLSSMVFGSSIVIYRAAVQAFR
jgi:uncharacterized membrane protein YecN with MAPEG domain